MHPNTQLTSWKFSNNHTFVQQHLSQFGRQYSGAPRRTFTRIFKILSISADVTGYTITNDINIRHSLTQKTWWWKSWIWNTHEKLHNVCNTIETHQIQCHSIRLQTIQDSTNDVSHCKLVQHFCKGMATRHRPLYVRLYH